MRRYSPLQTRPMSGGILHSPSRIFCALKRCLCRPPRSAFSFSACPMPVSLTSPCEDVGGFSLIRFSRCPLDSSTTGSHGSNGAGNPFCWYRFPISAQKSHTGAHRAEFGLTAFSWSALGLVGLPSPAPTCNLSPPGWDGWRIARCCSGFFHLESVLL